MLLGLRAEEELKDMAEAERNDFVFMREADYRVTP